MIVTDLLQFLFHFIFIGFPTLLWQVWRPWEQVFQKISVCVVFVFRYLSQEILHVFIDFQIVCLSSFGNAVDNRAGSGSADGVDQLPVVPSDTKTTQCGFCCIVVQRDFTVFQKYAQISFLIHGIGIGTNVKVKAYAEIRDELENSYIARMQQNMDFSGYEINYPKQFNIWINNIMSEVDFWVNSVAKENSQCREDYCKRLRNNRFRSELVGNAEFIEQYLCGIKEPLVYDIGCGLAPRFGETLWNGNKMSLVEIDPLAYFYNVINEKYAPVHDCRKIIFGMFEYFSDFFDVDSADAVIINNALDHCIDPYKSIVESVMVLKPGGVLHLNHARAEGVKGKYTGLHQWNLDYTGEDDFIIWNYDVAVNVTQRLKNIADIKLGHAGKNVPRSGQYVCVDMIKKIDFDKAQYVDINNENQNKAFIINRLMQALSNPAINSVSHKMLIDECEAEAQ